jgi:hypothetical protein
MHFGSNAQSASFLERIASLTPNGILRACSIALVARKSKSRLWTGSSSFPTNIRFCLTLDVANDCFAYVTDKVIEGTSFSFSHATEFSLARLAPSCRSTCSASMG